MRLILELPHQLTINLSSHVRDLLAIRIPSFLPEVTRPPVIFTHSAGHQSFTNAEGRATSLSRVPRGRSCLTYILSVHDFTSTLRKPESRIPEVTKVLLQNKQSIKHRPFSVIEPSARPFEVFRWEISQPIEVICKPCYCAYHICYENILVAIACCFARNMKILLILESKIQQVPLDSQETRKGTSSGFIRSSKSFGGCGPRLSHAPTLDGAVSEIWLRTRRSRLGSSGPMPREATGYRIRVYALDRVWQVLQKGDDALTHVVMMKKAFPFDAEVGVPFCVFGRKDDVGLFKETVLQVHAVYLMPWIDDLVFLVCEGRIVVGYGGDQWRPSWIRAMSRGQICTFRYE